jgi:hypothetical protein
MFAEPTEEDFSAWVQSHLDKALERARRALDKAEAEAAGKGVHQSGMMIARAFSLVQEEFDRGVETALGELKRCARMSKLNPLELRKITISLLQKFLVNAKVATKADTWRTFGPAKFINERLDLFDIKLNFALRQFDVGFFDPTEPTEPKIMTDNSIKIGGNVTASAIQQGSPGAHQSVKANASTFDNLQAVIEKEVSGSQERTQILRALQELRAAMESYGGTTGGSEYGIKYQRFIAAAASHMTIIAPFIPALTAWL